MYSVLITLHAVAGVAAFAAGLAALPAGRYFEVFRWSLAAMAGFLVLAIASDWAGRGPAAWLVPGALVVLAAVMLVRAEQARRVHPARVGGRSAAYVHRIGFGLVGLFDAFWVVALLRWDVPGGVVAAVGVGIAIVGHLALMRVAARVPVTVG